MSSQISGKAVVILVNAKYFCNSDDRPKYRNINFAKILPPQYFPAAMPPQ